MAGEDMYTLEKYLPNTGDYLAEIFEESRFLGQFPNVRLRSIQSSNEEHPTHYEIIKVGIDFYNLYYGRRKAIMEFLKDYVYETPYQLEDNSITQSELQDLEKKIVYNYTKAFHHLAKNELPIYKGIVDKVTKNAKLAEAEITHIKERLTPISQKKRRRVDKWFLDYDPNDQFGILEASYRFVVMLSRMQVSVLRCRLEGCNKIVYAGGPGKLQRYCSASHRVRGYKLRKESGKSIRGESTQGKIARRG